MMLLLLWPGRLHKNGSSADGFGVRRFEGKLIGQKSNTVASRFGI
jgi:hypothetical protein